MRKNSIMILNGSIKQLQQLSIHDKTLPLSWVMFKLEKQKTNKKKPPKQYKVNIQKYVAFLYTNNEISERESKKKSHLKLYQKSVSRHKLNQGSERTICCKL